MSEIRDTLRVSVLDIEEFNRVMGRIEDRLDAIEGRRGTPTFYSNVNLEGNRITNASPSETGSDVVVRSELDNLPDNLITPSIAAHAPSSVQTVAGTPAAGISVDDVYYLGDGNVYEVEEVAATPGFDIRFAWTNISNFHALVARQDYNGATTHWVGIDLYNYSKSSWDQITLARHTDEYYEYYSVYGINDANYINADGDVQARFYHYSGGNATHNIYIDYLALLSYTV